MRLADLTPAHVRRAIEIYLEHAWPPGAAEKPRKTALDFSECCTLDEILASFDSPDGVADEGNRRHVLRLGNHGYPFMKLVIQEYLMEGEYFFSVDTHDALRISPDMPDYEGWCDLRRHNRVLKEEIERAWADAGLPTHADLRRLAEGIAALEQGESKAARILVVDDERDVATGLAALLKARGYEVETAFDGKQVLERLDQGPRPDLLLLDYSMPEMDGEEVMQRLRADGRFPVLPILLATASSIDLESISRISGLLRKPYTRDVLFRMIERLLQAPH